jgi:hypothetical protein
MGFVEDAGAAQHLRDSRIASIYEGTIGIQAIDLVQRKLPLNGGETVARQITGVREIARAVGKRGGEAFGRTADRITEAAEALELSTKRMQGWLRTDPESALAGASPYLRLFGMTLGGDRSELGLVGFARFFAEKLLPVASGLAQAIASGAAPLMSYEAVLADTP